MTYRERGALGGKTTVQRYGNGYMAEIASRSGKAQLETKGVQYFKLIGKTGRLQKQLNEANRKLDGVRELVSNI